MTLLPRSAAFSVFLWSLLFFAVSLQMTTVLRPVLWWEEGDKVFVGEKMSFTQHLGEVSRRDRDRR